MVSTVNHQMRMGPEPGEERRFVSAVLPWIVAAVGLAVYLVTLNHWVSLANYPQVVKTAGWTWQPNLVTPITSDLLNPAYYVATFPLRWLAPKWIPLALNLFSAVCGALTLALLARSVALLPHDRTDEQRLRETSEFSTLSIPLAWLPPLLAAATCGLQLSFWEHSTNGTVHTFDLLLFAFIVCALLEYRIDGRESRLLRAALVCGAGMANNWVMIGLFPAFITALVWIRGVSFFNLRFLWRMSLCGLAGLLLYLLLPLVACLSKVEPINFWHALKANAIFIQEKNIARFPGTSSACCRSPRCCPPSSYPSVGRRISETAAGWAPRWRNCRSILFTAFFSSRAPGWRSTRRSARGKLDSPP